MSTLHQHLGLTSFHVHTLLAIRPCAHAAGCLPTYIHCDMHPCTHRPAGDDVTDVCILEHCMHIGDGTCSHCRCITTKALGAELDLEGVEVTAQLLRTPTADVYRTCFTRDACSMTRAMQRAYTFVPIKQMPPLQLPEQRSGVTGAVHAAQQR